MKTKRGKERKRDRERDRKKRTIFIVTILYIVAKKL